MELNLRKEKMHQIGFRTTEVEYNQIKEIAEKEGVSMGEVSRALIEFALKEFK